jgi:hypothetical protein
MDFFMLFMHSMQLSALDDLQDLQVLWHFSVVLLVWFWVMK